MIKLTIIILLLLINFSVFGQNNITLLSPNGGEIWQAGTTQTILWESDVGGDVIIDLYKGGSFHSVISGSTPNDGAKDWDIPFSMASGSDYSVNITSVNENASDVSDSTFTIVGYEITVIYPNGGEILCDGIQNNIIWEDNLSGNVEIQLLREGVFYSTIAASIPSNGIYSWNIPSGIGGGSNWLVKILSIENSNIFDISDSTFTIGCELTVLSPNGGEIWQSGTTQAILWESNVGGDVYIDLYKGESLYSVISGLTPNDGAKDWDIPFGIESGSDYSIKITSIDNPDIFDFSDSNFNIIGNYITVLTPNGGEVYCGGEIPITWESNNIGDFVVILLYHNGIVRSKIASTPNDGSYVWDIPYINFGGSDYLIGIGSIEYPASDVSDSTFTIGCDLTLLAPNGGEQWYWGTTQNITWSSENVIAVKIEISLDNGVSWLTIVDSAVSSGNYAWLVNPPQWSSECLIRISDVSDSNIIDQSNDVFTIIGVLGVNEESSGIPDSYKLLQNYPNPFNSSTKIYYGLPKESSVRITIYDVLGNELNVFNEDKQPAGYHTLDFNATEFRSGIYFYRLRAGDFIETKKMVLLK